jgi:predicted amino acid dehydrogenase
VREHRPDVTVIDGGIVRMPAMPRSASMRRSAMGNAYACMAETMMLAMEHRYQDASLGFDLSLNTCWKWSGSSEDLGFRVLLESGTPTRAMNVSFISNVMPPKH